MKIKKTYLHVAATTLLAMAVTVLAARRAELQGERPVDKATLDEIAALAKVPL